MRKPPRPVSTVAPATIATTAAAAAAGIKNLDQVRARTGRRTRATVCSHASGSMGECLAAFAQSLPQPVFDGVHTLSPSAWASAARPRLTFDLTVPGETPMAAAISRSDRSSQ